MSVLVFVFLVIVVLSLVCAAIQYAPIIQPMFKSLLIVIAIVIAIVFICHRVGWF